MNDECRRYRLYADLYSLCVLYDTWACVFPTEDWSAGKNVVNTMMACGAIMGLSVVMWTLFGYSLAFGGNHGGIIGDFPLVCAEWCRLGAGTLCGYDPASGICGVPDDVCHDHTGTDHRCRGWKNAF